MPIWRQEVEVRGEEWPFKVTEWLMIYYSDPIIRYCYLHFIDENKVW